MTDRPETFEEFKRSFAYGTRSDLGFKFLAALPDTEAAEFFRQLLEVLGDVFDTGEHERVRDLVFRWQVSAYERKEAKLRYDDGPFTPLEAPLAETTVALLSAGGVYVADDDPAGGETQAEAEDRIDEYLRTEPVLVAMPQDTPTSEVRVRHPGYDVRAARRDINAVFPLDVFRDAVADGVARSARRHYAFVGACSQLALRKTVAPAWAERLIGDDVGACLLVAT